MPRKRNLDLEQEINGDEVDVTEAEANDANTIVTAPVVEPASPAPLGTVSLTFDQIKELMSMSGQSAADLMATAMAAQSKTNAEAAARVRNPIPEGTDASYPRASVLNPLGEKDHPRPGLKCDFYLGTRMPKTGQVQRTYPFVADDLTAQEQIALNTLEPGSAKIELLDGAEIKVDLVATRDDITDAITRIVLVVPQHVIEKKSAVKNMLPSICKIVEQITGHNFAKLSTDDLAYFMAEHRKKNFVAEREKVAA